MWPFKCGKYDMFLTWNEGSKSLQPERAANGETISVFNEFIESKINDSIVPSVEKNKY